MPAGSQDSPTASRLAAWSVHLLTASGALWGILALAAAIASRFEIAFAWLALASFVDAIDGALARRIDVRRVLPAFDGTLLDNLVDYLNYTIVPAWIMVQAGVLPERLALGACGTIAVVSALQFSHAEAKTSDHYFRGFPSYWNVVAFYLVLLDPVEYAALAIVLALCVLSVVPIRFVYPTRTERFRGVTLLLGAVWGAVIVALLLRFDDAPRWLVGASLFYPAYYFALSFYLTRAGAIMTGRPPGAP